MPGHFLDHIDLRVSDLVEAGKFHDGWLPALGLSEIVVEAGARAVEGPEYCHDCTPGYYAVFFEDADGNKWEICCRTARVR